MSWFPVGSNEECHHANTAGIGFEPLPCLYPNSLGKTYTNWELNHNPIHVRDWMVNNPWVPIVAVTLYGLFIVAGRRFFRDRQAWSWRRPLAVWNLCLSVFSFVGLARTLPQLLHNYYHYSVPQNLCFDPESHFGSGPTGIWIQAFVLSKFPELMDTFFIVIHKKPLIFLHWYHHISVLLYCWHSYVTNSPAGIAFVTMNYAVHSLMYFYYFLMAVNLKPKWFNSKYLTLSQISQMVVGVTVTVAAFLVQPKYPEGQCWLKKENTVAALIMYGSYLFLFVQFFVQRYSVVAKAGAKTKSA